MRHLLDCRVLTLYSYCPFYKMSHYPQYNINPGSPLFSSIKIQYKYNLSSYLYNHRGHWKTASSLHTKKHVEACHRTTTKRTDNARTSYSNCSKFTAVHIIFFNLCQRQPQHAVCIIQPEKTLLFCYAGEHFVVYARGMKLYRFEQNLKKL